MNYQINIKPIHKLTHPLRASQLPTGTLFTVGESSNPDLDCVVLLKTYGPIYVSLENPQKTWSSLDHLEAKPLEKGTVITLIVGETL